MDPRHLIKNSSKINQPDEDFISVLFNLIKNNEYCKTDAIKPLKDADQATICAIKEALRDRLLSIASRLLNSQHSKFEDLTEEDKNLWTQFDNSDIYEFITGKKDTLPEFQYNWIEPCQLAVHLPPGVSPQNFQAPSDQPKPQLLLNKRCFQHNFHNQLRSLHREGINRINHNLLRTNNQ
jgi:hypothetical protein